VARVTQRVAAEEVADLVALPRRAALAFARAGSAVPLPVRYRRNGERIAIGLARESLGGPVPERGVLVVDDGSWWFELRAVTWRGRLEATTPPAGEDQGLLWLEFVPEREVAWNYGALHEAAE
jgi:hypothetical protein